MMTSLYEKPVYKIRNSAVPLSVFWVGVLVFLGNLEYRGWLPTWLAFILTIPGVFLAGMHVRHAYLRLHWAIRTYRSHLPKLMLRMLKLFPRLARCRAETAKIGVHITLAALGLASVAHFHIYSPLCISAFLLAVAATATLRILLPPGGVYLASSNPDRIRLFSQLSLRTIPAFAALLDLSNLLDPDTNSSEFMKDAVGTLNDYRTSDPADWTHVVERLIEMTAIVLVDGRDETPGVKIETERILRCRLDFKTTFLSVDGELPPILKSLNAKSTHPSGNFQIMTPDMAAQVLPLIIQEARAFWIPVRMDA